MNENEVYLEGYGFVEQLPVYTYYKELISWSYVDDLDDGIMLVMNEYTGELRYVEFQGR